ncbi:MAG: preprotein translocase subunit SecG [Planctomycetes bacterium]|nr:preprotein translocase subunit SecG [Planctomycetota bacterium]
MNLDLVVTLLYIVFIVSAIVLCIVVLLQEGKGGGLTDALGTAGQQTFGVAASGIHKFTGWTGAVFIVSALLIHVMNRQAASDTIVDDSIFNPPTIQAPAVPPGAGDAGTPPPGG